jgi:hypothetical protein
MQKKVCKKMRYAKEGMQKNEVCKKDEVCKKLRYDAKKPNPNPTPKVCK